MIKQVYWLSDEEWKRIEPLLPRGAAVRIPLRPSLSFRYTHTRCCAPLPHAPCQISGMQSSLLSKTSHSMNVKIISPPLDTTQLLEKCSSDHGMRIAANAIAKGSNPRPITPVV